MADCYAGVKLSSLSGVSRARARRRWHVASAALAVALAVAGGGVCLATPALPEGWASFDGVSARPTPPRLDVVESTASGLVVTVSIPGMVGTSVVEEQMEYRKLELPSYYRCTDVGRPAVPVIREMIALPLDCSVSVDVTATDSLVFSGTRVYPAPEIVVRYTPEGWEYLEEEFSLDESAYQDNALYPSVIASVDSLGSLRGQGVALLTIYPVRYRASTEETVVFTSLTVSLTFSGGRGGIAESIGPMQGMADDIILNYQGSGGGAPRGGRGAQWQVCTSLGQCESLQTDYLMIVEGSLPCTTHVRSLAEHRVSFNGFNVAIVPDTVIINYYGDPGMSDTAIRDFIVDLYDSESAAHMADGHLGYVLLVGDAEEGDDDALLPAHEYTYFDAYDTSDWFYACVDGTDQYADLSLGRLCARDTTELRREVQRFIEYEQTASSSQGWRDDILLSCGFAWIGGSDCSSGDQSKAETVHAAFDSVASILQAASAAYNVCQIHAHAAPGDSCRAQYDYTRPQNVARVSEGRHIVELCVHGNPYGTYTFEWYSVANLTNNEGELPFWMSYSCRTGAFDFHGSGYPQSWRCLGERLLHETDDTGAIAYFGASENAQDISWKALGKYVWKALFLKDYGEVGPATTYARLKFIARNGEFHEARIYNLLGDPALDIMQTDAYQSTDLDFAVAEEGIYTLPSFASYGVSIELCADVRNESNYDADPMDPVEVSLELWEPDGNSPVMTGTDYVAPEAWSSERASLVWGDPTNSDVGEYLLKVAIDTADVCQEVNKNNNEAEAPICVYFERDGFPKDVGGEEGLSPILTDLDGQNGAEVLLSVRCPARVVAYSVAADTTLWAFEEEASTLRGSPAVGDVNYDGVADVVICYDEEVTVLEGDTGDKFDDFPVVVSGLISGPSLGDFRSGDGELEIQVQCDRSRQPIHHEIVLISSQGQIIKRSTFSAWELHEPPRLESCASLADLDGDGHVDGVAGFRDMDGSSGTAAAANGMSGDVLWQLLLGSLGNPMLSAIQPCDPAIADIAPYSEGIEVLCGGHALYCISADGDTLGTPYDVRGFLSGVAVSDLDGDDALEVVCATYGLADEPDAQAGHVLVLEKTPAGWSLVDSTSIAYPASGQPVVSDLDGDGYPEIIVVSTEPRWDFPDPPDLSHLDILTLGSSGTLTTFLDRPLFFWGTAVSTPLVADTDSDGHLEIWFVDGEGYAHCLEYWGESDALSRWCAFQHDERHTGTYETPMTGDYPSGSEISWWGDYYLTGDVKIDSLSTMLIQPGTTVRVAPNSDDTSSGTDPGLTELIAAGSCTLRAYGTEACPTTLASAADTAAAGQWRGVRVMATGGAYPQHPTAEVRGVSISHACIGVATVGPETLRVHDCTIDDCQMMGVKCTCSSGWSHIELKRNKISDVPVGIELHGCAALVDTNAISRAWLDGMKIYQDEGSVVRGNTMTEGNTKGGAPVGIFIQGAQDDLRITDRNNVSDVRYGVYCDRSYNGTIEDNVFAGDAGSAVGMYFYDSSPSVGRNTLTGTLGTGFRVAGPEGSSRPVLGIADTDTTVACCADTTVPRCNRLVPTTKGSPYYYVKVEPGSNETVMAESNYWDPDKSFSSSFYGPVDWSPRLHEDPEGGRGDGGSTADTPVALQLAQNCPNPFNPTTLIRYAVPVRTHVKLVIYDLTGRRVRTLVDGHCEPGWHEIVWDGRNDRGDRAASGVYFCRLDDGRSVSSKKVVLLK